MARIIKRSTKGVSQRFALYDGPTPTRGVYRSKITSANVYISGNNNPVLYFVAVAEAREGDPRAKYDGYASHVRITLGDADALKEREQALYLAIAGKEDAEIKAEKNITAEDKQNKILSIGGVNPVGKYVNVNLRDSGDPTYPIDVDGIYPIRGEQGGSKSKAPADEEAEEAEELELYEKNELQKKSLAALRKILVDEFEMDEDEAKELKQKSKLIEAILEAQEEDEDEELDDEDEVEDEDLEDEDLDEDEVEDEDEEEVDREEEIREELADLTRNQLKVRVKKLNPDFRITTKTDDDAIRDEIVRIEKDAPPF